MCMELFFKLSPNIKVIQPSFLTIFKTVVTFNLWCKIAQTMKQYVEIKGVDN